MSSHAYDEVVEQLRADLKKPVPLYQRLVKDPPATTKPSNPKDAIGSDKLPLHLWPPVATVYGALGLTDGAFKYGRGNWREAGVRYTIYLDAIMRHTFALLESEDTDPDSALHHISHILASAAIIADAMESGKLIDDRNYRGGFWRKFLDRMTPNVARLRKHHSDKSPKHWTQADNPVLVPPSGALPDDGLKVDQTAVHAYDAQRRDFAGRPCPHIGCD